MLVPVARDMMGREVHHTKVRAAPYIAVPVDLLLMDQVDRHIQVQGVPVTQGRVVLVIQVQVEPVKAVRRCADDAAFLSLLVS